LSIVYENFSFIFSSFMQYYRKRLKKRRIPNYPAKRVPAGCRNNDPYTLRRTFLHKLCNMNTVTNDMGGISLKSVDFRNDPMFLRNQFPRDGTFEMPVIKKTKLDLEGIELIGYDKLSEGQTEKFVHFKR